jgi:hypothetical protein
MANHLIHDAHERFGRVWANSFAHWHKDAGYNLTPANLSVFVALAMRADYSGYDCIPSLQTIANDCGINRDTVASSITALERAGLIGVERRSENGRLQSSRYTILAVENPLVADKALPNDSASPELVVGSADYQTPVSSRLTRLKQEEHVKTNSSNELLDAPQPGKPAKQEKPKPASKPKSNRGTRIPDSFQITDELRKWAIAEGATAVQVERETAKFVDYWSAVPGARGVKLDWIATWRNWIRRNLEDHRTGYAGGGNGHASDTVYGTDELQAVYRAQGQEQREYEPIPLVKPNRRNTPASSGNGRVDSHNGPQRTKGT